ncbi:TPA: ribosomal L7Ae/L30e/S12e/Gadd45 family protein [archaeon]|uniref:Ribosomal L7Ae/L30e/S12e/Gadd45 family protein n=1 Tax=Candidatus Naiadarchaeum limnaeum TaxID=2756139 RepID=A0A832XJL0_9ARCH|nr:ribosomal L7Ae/L30e/S12e/Gadd45 family protein [Candidatus Naiadarchaeum limnaeum]
MTTKSLTIEVEIRKAIKAKKILFGKKQTEKALKVGKAKLVILSRDCFYRDSVENYAKLANAEIVNFDGGPYKLGAVCERQHAINALVLLK